MGYRLVLISTYNIIWFLKRFGASTQHMAYIAEDTYESVNYTWKLSVV